MVDIKLKKKEAAEFLGRKGRRIEIIFFGLLLVFVTVTPIYLSAYLEYFFFEILEQIGFEKSVLEFVSSTLAILFGVIFAIFLTLPIFYCFFAHSYRTYRNGIAGERKYFAFGKSGYFGAMRSGAVIFGIFALCLIPVIVLVELGRIFASSADKRVATLVSYLFFIIVAVGLVLGFLIFLLFKPFFLFVYYVSKGEKLSRAISQSVKRMSSPRAKQIYWEYIKGFLPPLLLSLATLLVLFFLDTLPKMSIVYFNVADEIVSDK